MTINNIQEETCAPKIKLMKQALSKIEKAARIVYHAPVKLMSPEDAAKITLFIKH